MNRRGFTLIEVIVIIVVGGIVAAMLVPFMGSALTKSHEPIDNLERAAGLSSDMAKVVAKLRENNGGNNTCKTLIENLPDQSELDTRIGCFIKDESSGNYTFENEAACEELEKDPIYILEVSLQGQENPGETSTFLFPCKKDGNDE